MCVVVCVVYVLCVVWCVLYDACCVLCCVCLCFCVFVVLVCPKSRVPAHVPRVSSISSAYTSYIVQYRGKTWISRTWYMACQYPSHTNTRQYGTDNAEYMWALRVCGCFVFFVCVRVCVFFFFFFFFRVHVFIVSMCFRQHITVCMRRHRSPI